jgi:hypothetical protein
MNCLYAGRLPGLKKSFQTFVTEMPYHERKIMLCILAYKPGFYKIVLWRTLY